MARLKAANNAITKLTVGITAADTSFTVEDAALFPDAPFRVTIDAEIMQVEAIDKLTNTFSAVQRGLEGTVAAPHNNGAEVANRWTAGYLETLATLEEAQAIATTTADDVVAAHLASGLHIPQGVIVMWSGLLTAVPSGWALCDGNNGTPDLRDRFIVGAGNEYEVGTTGGEKTHSLTEEELPSHQHSVSITSGSAGSHSHSGSTNTTGSHTHSYKCGYSSSSPVDGVETKSKANPDGALETSSSGLHSHTVSTNSAGSHSHSVSGNTSSSGSGAAHENRPPYFALAFIMKL